jgi:CoA:oxalate CoA-transferase
MGGLLSQTGYDGGPPIKPAPALADISGAVYGAIGVLAALVKREKTGKGSKVDVNLLDGAMSLLSMHYAIYFLNGIVQRPLGSGHPQSVPFGAYKTGCKTEKNSTH